jgi:hypothetical protein
MWIDGIFNDTCQVDRLFSVNLEDRTNIKKTGGQSWQDTILHGNIRNTTKNPVMTENALAKIRTKYTTKDCVKMEKALAKIRTKYPPKYN